MAFIHDYITNPNLIPVKWWKCEDFSWSVSDNMVQVSDHAEGCSYRMTHDQIKNALVECLIDYCDEVDLETGEQLLSVEGAQYQAEKIMTTATPLGLCCFVKNYCEV